jgi:type II secretory ATPase GspE/PulE/Tfp pilus assembly ATPase PilB-like protein
MSSTPSTGTIQSASYKDKLLEIANRVNAAPGVKDILTILKDSVPDLVGSERVTIYALDVKNQQLYTLLVVGQGVKEIRIPKNFSSISGFTALSKKTVNIRDAYDTAELTRIHANLRLDQRWDQKEGFRTKQVLATPILFEKYLMGVIQVINKRGGGQFTREDEVALTEISRILGVALYNQRRVTRQSQPNKFGYLIDKGIISEKQLREAVTYARMNVKDIGSVLIEKFKVPKRELGQSLSAFYNTQFFEWDGSNVIPADLKDRISSDFLLKNVCVPIRKEAGATTFVVEDPFDLAKLDYVKMLGVSPRYEFWIGLQTDIIECINANYKIEGKSADSMDDILDQLSEMASGEVLEEEEEDEQEEDLDEKDNAVVRLANQIIHDAHKRGASDIHVEPYGPKIPCMVRYRIDGVCENVMEVPGAYRSALVSRLKIMSRLDIAEKHKPQDGKIRFKGAMGEIELRVATIPTTNNNEDIVMRILASSKPLPVDKLGMSERNRKELKQIIAKPYGIFLCVGPTGSGKTTTLHSCVGAINTPERKIWTVEDPVEITQKGLRQVQINLKKDVTFANAMRAFLRADPDVIMVGEMRDHETAAIGIEASLTGHLVLSTLHTNSAPETITRLLDMDLDPFNFSDALLGILAQRLARTLCSKCREAYQPDSSELDELISLYGLEHWDRLGVERQQVKLYRPKGCEACNDGGYKGRMGLHELLLATDDAKRLIARRASIEEIRDQAIRDGMTTLLQDGIWKALNGHLDLKSVKAVCIK